MAAIIVDTEYTTWPGALESGWSSPGQHREIVQIAAIQVDSEFREIRSLDLLVRPGINPVLSDLFVELTGIGQKEVDRDGLRFEEALERFYGFAWRGSLPVVCMNADEAVFRENCGLAGIEFPFERSWHRLRPFLEASGVDLSTRSSGDLHLLTPTPLVGHTHNALHDVRSMAAWIRHARGSILSEGLEQLSTGAPDRDPRSMKAGG